MIKLIVICFLVFFAISSNAQINNKTDIRELNQDQLNLALAKSLQTIKGGKILTGVGAALGITGSVLIGIGINKSNNSTDPLGGLPSDETVAGSFILIGGITTAGIGIYTWTKGLNRKKEIEIELVKFKPTGLASTNGIGIRIRF